LERRLNSNLNCRTKYNFQNLYSPTIGDRRSQSLAFLFLLYPRPLSLLYPVFFLPPSSSLKTAQFFFFLTSQNCLPVPYVAVSCYYLPITVDYVPTDSYMMRLELDSLSHVMLSYYNHFDAKIFIASASFFSSPTASSHPSWVWCTILL